MSTSGNIIPINIEEEMRNAYIDYSMSVIVSRALPDVRDGLKPVHRRVLFGMHELGVNYNKPYKKSARIVGEVLGKYHPHGDSSVYDTMVRMAQEWSLRYPLVDGQGNFGSLDGDSPAAMRYTEARLKRIAEEMLTDINKETVDFEPNFDDSLKEPSVLPGKLPNLLLNGASGIAVGMATNMPPHNLTEVVDGIHAYIDNNEIEISELTQLIKGPDFPTGATIYGYQGIKSAFETGRGRVVMRGDATFEESKSGKQQIIIHSIPYLVNKALMIEKMAGLVNEKKIDGVTDIRDESDRKGLRVVLDLRRDANSSVILNNLYKYSPLQSSFGVNNIALVNGKPEALNLKQMIKHFVDHRHEVVIRRTEYELKQAEKRAHILEGLIIASDNIDEVIQIIRASKSPDEARESLIKRFELSEEQSRAIVEMRLRQLTGLEQEKLRAEYEEVKKLIERLKEILANEDVRMGIIKDELSELKERYGDERRTQIVHSTEDISDEDMIPNDEMVITISNEGYIKRTPLQEYKSQGRGGVGSRGASSKADDYTEHLLVATMHNYLLVFTNSGKVFWVKTYLLPEGSKTAKGRPIQNVIQIDGGDKIMAVIAVDNLKDEDYINNHYLIMCTKSGIVKKTTLQAYSRPRQNGINAITIREGDELLEVKLTTGSSEIIIAKKSGKAIRFNEEGVRPMGRTAAGVKGVTLEGDKDFVVGMAAVSNPEDTLLVVSEKGYGKRSDLEEYRITSRGGKGVKTLNITDKTGSLVALKSVTDEDDMMIINKSGITIRMAADKISVIGRATQGVRLIKLSEKDEISSVAVFKRLEEEEVVDGEAEEANGENEEGAKPENNESEE